MNEQEVGPLSWQQEGRLQRDLQRGERFANIVRAWPIPTHLSDDVLLERLSQLARREDSLRVDRVSLADGGSVSYRQAVTLPLRRAVVGSRQELADLCTARTLDYFARDGELLWDACLLTCDQARDDAGPQRFLCTSFDHIIWDGRSQAVLGEALFAEDPTLAESGSCREFIRWQREAFADPLRPGEGSAQFWRRHLAGTAPDRPVELPFRIGDEVPPTGSAVSITRRSPVGVQQLRSAAAAARATPFVVFLAAVAHAIYRAGGGTDVTFRVNTAGRPPAYLNTLGYFAENLPVRVVGPGLEDPRGAVTTARERWFETIPHQDVPWDFLLCAAAEDRQIVTRQSGQALVNFIPWARSGEEPPAEGLGTVSAPVSTFQTAGTMWEDGSCWVECVFDPARFELAGAIEFAQLICDSLARVVQGLADSPAGR